MPLGSGESNTCLGGTWSRGVSWTQPTINARSHGTDCRTKAVESHNTDASQLPQSLPPRASRPKCGRQEYVWNASCSAHPTALAEERNIRSTALVAISARLVPSYPASSATMLAAAPSSALATLHPRPACVLIPLIDIRILRDLGPLQALGNLHDRARPRRQ